MASERDHVSQVYLGLVDVGPTGHWLRRRIDWMADEARGPRVLDVGCSEGILEVLLARHAYTVTGIDIDPEALEFAQHLLAKESEEVRARVRFIHGDFKGAMPVGGLYDTVVMGELLDHLDDPGAMLDMGLKHLQPGGRVVITTRFGAHPDEGNRRTFCLKDFIDLLKPRFGLESLCIEDNHIRFVGCPSVDEDDSWQRLDSEAILSMTDAALVDSQKEPYGLLAAQGTRIERLQQRIQQLVEENRVAQRRVNTDNKRFKKLELRTKLDHLAFTHLKEQFRARTKELNASAGEVRARTKELNASAREVRAKTRELGWMNYSLEVTRSSTSFLVGSAIVDAARKPLTSWKLPFQLLRLYRSKSTPPPPLPSATMVSEVSSAPPPYVSEEPEAFSEDVYPDPSRFIDLPLPPMPEARADGPPVAAILDTFTEYSLRHEVNLLPISPDSWRAELEETRPVCLFVESAWRGNSGLWRDKIVEHEGAENETLLALLEYCRSTGIPTVFWNKEDPTNFDYFLRAAKEFDFVFTSDADCVPRYREKLGHCRIYALPFAAQPRLHNPSREEDWPRYPVCFPGSWAPQRYPERAETLLHLLNPAIEYGLHIFDRNLTRTDLDSDYRFPNRYKEAIKGTLTYEEMLTAYRCYDVMLNVNTVTDSATMFSRRVFESLACGTPVVSSESVGMSRMLGEHVRVTRSIEETTNHLEELLGDEEARVREGHLAYRYVHENHTYRHRMDEVFRTIGLEPLDSEQPSVSVVTVRVRPENVRRCLDNFKKQTYENKELILVLNSAEFDLDAIRRDAERIPNVQVLHVGDRTTLGDCLNRGVEAASGKYIAKMNDEDYYGERYLSDHVLAASFSLAQIVGKGMYYVHFEASDTTALREIAPDHTFTSSTLAGGTLFIQADVVRDIPFDSYSISEDADFLRSARIAGCPIYAADRFNYVRLRPRQLLSHSWQIPDSEFLKKCRDFTHGLDLGRAMI